MAATTHRPTLSVLVFISGKALAINLPWMQEIGRPRTETHLPVVLSPDEVARVLCALKGETLLCDDLASERIRHSYRSGVNGTCRRGDNHDLYACIEGRWPRSFVHPNDRFAEVSCITTPGRLYPFGIFPKSCLWQETTVQSPGSGLSRRLPCAQSSIGPTQ